MSTVELFKSILEKRRRKVVDERNAALKSEFFFIERDGSLWITHLGVAIMRIPDTMSIADAMGALNKYRESAVEFEKL